MTIISLAKKTTLVLALSLLLGASLGAADAKTNLNIALTGDATSLDPHNATDSISWRVNYQIFDRLVTFDAKLKIVPQLAESWTASADAKTYTFKLRKGVAFHDGTSFNAEAVKVNFDRLADKANKLSQYGTIGQYIESVVTNGDYGVTIKLNTPQAAFLSNIAIAAGSIISPKSIKENPQGISKHPVGTGPFKFKEWNPGDSLVLEANDAYFGGKPAVRTVTFKTVPENSSRVIQLETGEADFIEQIPPTELKRLEAEGKVVVNTRFNNRILYVGINNAKPVLNNPKVRLALNLAVDRNTLTKKLYEGRVRPAESFFSEYTFGTAKVGAYPYDLAKAKTLLQEANVKPESLTLRIVYAGNTTQDRPAAEFVQNSIQKLGIKVDLAVLELGAYFDALKKPESYDLYVRGASTLTGDADALFRESFLSTSTLNYAKYKNTKVDDLILKAGGTSNAKTRIALYAEASKIIKEDAPWIPLYEDVAYSGFTKQVKGVLLLPSLLWDLRHVSLQ